ncbi:MAG: chemotaxis response regulator protein-glutamate methylesterase [Candidatus Omnitrophica bacterium]|nr:chemotaxis response regulator protein-glutamate methylesterase [Candidatus Omnitrophota bacterium]
MKKVKVLIVDDSSVVRNVLTEEMSKDARIEVVGTAMDPYIARDKVVTLKPDVLVLDVEMPRMDGITFLSKLMKHAPMPVIIFSSLTPEGCETALEALSMGAIEVMHKPDLDVTHKLREAMVQLQDKIIAASKVRYKFTVKEKVKKKKGPSFTDKGAMIKTTDKVVAIGASTGGTEAIREILPTLPANFPGIVITQHMPAQFTKTFADSLNKQCVLEVREARDNDTIRPGLVLIAPGNYHMLLRRSGARYYVQVKDGPLVHHQRPSIEILFNSVAKYAGSNSIGAILTGMGSDGAAGLLNMKNAGAHTIAQDEKSCVVYGMPKAAVEQKAAVSVISLKNIPGELMQKVSR